MKRLIFIVALVLVVSFGFLQQTQAAIVFTQLIKSQATPVTGTMTTLPITPTANHLIVAVFANISPFTVTGVVGNNLTWQRLDAVSAGAVLPQTLSVFYAMGSSPVTGPLTITTGSFQPVSYMVYDVGGTDTIQPIVQHLITIAMGASSASATLGAFSNPNNIGVGFVTAAGALSYVPGASLSALDTYVTPQTIFAEKSTASGGPTTISASWVGSSKAVLSAFEIKAGTTGDIESKRVGSDLTVATAPAGTTASAGGNTSALNSAVFSNLALNSQVTSVSNNAAYAITAGVCTYPKVPAGQTCSVSAGAFSSAGISCDASQCYKTVDVSSGYVTKVAWKYDLPPGDIVIERVGSDLTRTSAPTTTVALLNPPTNGLAAYYKLNDSAVDSSGNGLNGVLNNPSAWSDGILGRDVNFSNGLTYVRIPSSTLYPDETISAWIKPSSANVGSTGVILSSLNWTGTSNDGYILQYNAGNLSYSIYANDLNGTSLSLTAPVQGDVWHHVVVVHTSGDIRMYVDDVLKASSNRYLGFKCVTTACIPTTHIGSYNYQSNQYYFGQVDDVRIYNRVLSNPEIATLGSLVNPALFQNEPVGVHYSPYFSYLPFYNFSFGTCSYQMVGGTPCNPPSYQPVSINDCDIPGGLCNIFATAQYNVQSGMVTKYVVKYDSTTGVGDAKITVVDKFQNPITNPVITSSLDSTATSTSNPSTFVNVVAGNHTALFINNYATSSTSVVTYATCSYVRGTNTGCTPLSTSFSTSTVSCSTITNICTAPLPITPGSVTMGYFKIQISSGDIQVTRVGGDGQIGSVPPATMSYMDSTPPVQCTTSCSYPNPVYYPDYSNFTSTHTVYVTYLTGQQTSFGSCTYAIGTSPCTVTTFDIVAPTCSSATGYCYTTYNTSPGMVTNIVAKYTSSAPVTNTAAIRIKMVGPTNATSSVPVGVISKVASSTSASNPYTYQGFNPGTSTAYASYKNGYVVNVGTCTYPNTATSTECTMTQFPLTPTCDATWCSYDVNTLSNTITKIVFKYSTLASPYITCGASPLGAGIGKPITWNATTTPASTAYSYFWSGDPDISGNNLFCSGQPSSSCQTYTTSYGTTGIKTGTVTVYYGGSQVGSCTNTAQVSKTSYIEF